MALPQPRVKIGSEFYVHIPEGRFTVYKPLPSEVADSVVTDEHWICEPVKVKCVGRIRINNKYDSGEIFSYKGEDFVVYDWNYFWIEVREGLDNPQKQRIISDFNDMLNDFNYGIVIDGHIVTENEDIDLDFDKYRTLSSKEFLEYKTGVCWDYTHFEALYFLDVLRMKLVQNDWLRFNDTISMYYMEFDDKDGDTPTHTWLAYRLNDRIYAFESSWKPYRGITEFASEEDMIQTYIDRQERFYRSIDNPIYSPKVWKYLPMKTGLDCVQFMKRIREIGVRFPAR